MRKTVIYFNAERFNNLEKSVIATCREVNEVITAFNEHSPGVRVRTLEEVEGLISNPIEFFDSELLKKIPQPAGLAINTAKLAELYNIDRAGFLVAIFGQRVVKGGCYTCSHEDVLNYTLNSDYEQYRSYLTFTNGKFEVNETLLSEAKNDYTIFANEEQKKHLKDLQDFVSTCNKLRRCGIIGSDVLQSMKAFAYDWNRQVLALPFEVHILLGKIQHHEQNSVTATNEVG
jgi:hypothetical protein